MRDFNKDFQNIKCEIETYLNNLTIDELWENTSTHYPHYFTNGVDYLEGETDDFDDYYHHFYDVLSNAIDWCTLHWLKDYFKSLSREERNSLTEYQNSEINKLFQRWNWSYDANPVLDFDFKAFIDFDFIVDFGLVKYINQSKTCFL